MTLQLGSCNMCWFTRSQSSNDDGVRQQPAATWRRGWRATTCPSQQAGPAWSELRWYKDGGCVVVNTQLSLSKRWDIKERERLKPKKPLRKVTLWNHNVINYWVITEASPWTVGWIQECEGPQWQILVITQTLLVDVKCEMEIMIPRKQEEVDNSFVQMGSYFLKHHL